MTPGVARYWKRLDEWMEARKASGDTLSQDQESEHMTAVDDIWRGLTTFEQDAIEREDER